MKKFPGRTTKGPMKRKTKSRPKKSQDKPERRSVALSNFREDGRALIANAKLERFPNRTQVRRYEIKMSCPEFTCVCPASGFPDFATIHIRYIPKKWCVELKSLKLYLNRYRDRGIFHEEVINVILDDLVQLLDPFEAEVVGDFNVRGNIKTIIRAKHPSLKKLESQPSFPWYSSASPGEGVVTGSSFPNA